MLRVPGTGAAIISGDSIVWRGQFGYADLATHRPMTDHTAFPVASLTKTMAATVVMQLVQEGRVNVDVADTALRGPYPVTIANLLSHTSEGAPGEEYLYSGARYNQLGRVVEQASSTPLAVALRARVFDPAGMSHTTAGSRDAAGQMRMDIAAPYASVAEDSSGTKPGSPHFPDVAAANGVVSTAEDLARYAIALLRGDLVSGALRDRMWTPARSTRGVTFPYGLGWFVQDYAGERIVWHYGQESSYGSLLLLVPSRRLGVIVLANSNAISDAARLLDGNVARSLVAQAFLRDVARLQVPEGDAEIAAALAELYAGHKARADSLARAAHTRLAEASDLAGFYLLFRLADSALDAEAREVEERLLADHPGLPPVLYFAALFEERAGTMARAAELLERIAATPAPPRHWSVVLGLSELAKLYEPTNPSRARVVYQRIVDINYNFGGAVDRAKERLAKLR